MDRPARPVLSCASSPPAVNSSLPQSLMLPGLESLPSNHCTDGERRGVRCPSAIRCRTNGFTSCPRGDADGVCSCKSGLYYESDSSLAYRAQRRRLRSCKHSTSDSNSRTTSVPSNNELTTVRRFLLARMDTLERYVVVASACISSVIVGRVYCNHRRPRDRHIPNLRSLRRLEESRPRSSHSILLPLCCS